MIKATISKGYKETKIHLIGHADYKTEEFDAVCGMVSCLTQANLQAIEDYTNITKQESGELEASVYRCNITDAIVNAIQIGLQAIAVQFPKCIEVTTDDDNRRYSI